MMNRINIYTPEIYCNIGYQKWPNICLSKASPPFHPAALQAVGSTVEPFTGCQGENPYLRCFFFVSVAKRRWGIGEFDARANGMGCGWLASEKPEISRWFRKVRVRGNMFQNSIDPGLVGK